jgi:copper transport protein
VTSAVRGHGGIVLLAALLALAALFTSFLDSATQIRPQRSGLAAADPPPNAMLVDAPSRIALTFAEPVEAFSVSIRLLGAGDDEQLLSPVQADAASDRAFFVRPQGVLGADDYTILWSARASADGALLAGAYPFRTGLVTNPGAAQLDGQWPEPWATILRWLTFLGTALAVGGFAWSRLLRPSHGAPAQDRLWRGGVMVGSALVALISTLLPPILRWLLASDSGQTTLTGSLRLLPLGWWVQAIALIALALLSLGALVGGGTSASMPSTLAWSGLGVGMAALVGSCFTSHAAAAHDGTLLVVEIPHQWSTALWVSGLLYLTAGWRELGSDIGRFRTVRWVGGLFFAISVITGSAMAWSLASSLGGLLSSQYGQVLAGKSVLVFIVLILGLLALVIPRRASARVASGSLGAQSLVAIIATLFAALMALLAAPRSIVPATLAAVDLVAVVPLDAKAFGVGSGVVHVMTQPAGTNMQTITVRVTDDRGASLTATPVPDVQLDWISLGDVESQERNVTLRADPTGALFTGAIALPQSGWWQANVVIVPQSGIATRALFWFVSPDPNLTDHGPEPTTEPAAQALFERGLTSLRALRSVRLSQRVNDGAGSLARSRTAVSIAANGEPATFDDSTIDAAGDVVSQQRVIGDRRWTLVREEGWVESEPIAFQTPADWAAAYGDATGFQLGPREEIDGELCQVVTFWQPPRADLSRAPAWRAWWIGLASGEVRREATVSTRDYMDRGFSDFDAPLEIQPPVMPVTSTPVATPGNRSATPVATPRAIK